MDIGSILLILALFILVAMFVARPFFEHKATTVSHEEQEHSALLAERDRIINALQELEFDFTMGKIPEEDYPAQRTLLLQRGANVLRMLDEYQGSTFVHGGVPKEKAGLEAALAAAEAGSSGVVVEANPAIKTRTPVGADDELEALIANRRRARQEKSTGFCPNCGGPLQKSDLFCPKCGTGVKG